MRRTLMTFTALALFAPTLLAAQTAGTQADATAQARIEAALEHALSVGVPVEMLEAKIAEGRAKGVAMTRIAAAVEHRAEVLTRVQTALAARGEAVSQSELQAAGDAHERGVSAEKIAELSARAGNDRAAALTVLADLVASGRTPEHALLRVTAALDGGASALVRLSEPPRGNAATVQAGSSTTAEARGQGGTVRGAAAGGVRVKVGG